MYFWMLALLIKRSSLIVHILHSCAISSSLNACCVRRTHSKSKVAASTSLILPLQRPLCFQHLFKETGSTRITLLHMATSCRCSFRASHSRSVICTAKHFIFNRLLFFSFQMWRSCSVDRKPSDTVRSSGSLTVSNCHLCKFYHHFHHVFPFCPCSLQIVCFDLNTRAKLFFWVLNFTRK